ncbi:hypothetical protein IAT38_004167 [Cryptococcus sp. DSM 104549]
MRLPYPRPHRVYAPRKYRMPGNAHTHSELAERQVGGKGQAEDEADARVTTTAVEAGEAGTTHEGGAQEVVTATRAGAGEAEASSAGRETSTTAHEEGATTTTRAGASTTTSAHTESSASGSRDRTDTMVIASATGESSSGATHSGDSSVTPTQTEESVTDAATVTVARSSVLHPIYVNSFPSDFPIETQTKGVAGTLGRGYVFLPHNMVADSMLLFVTFFFSLLILTISCIKISTCLNKRRGGGKEDTVIGEEMRWAEGRTVLERRIVWDTGSVYGGGGQGQGQGQGYGQGYGSGGGRSVARGRTPVGESKLRL